MEKLIADITDDVRLALNEVFATDDVIESDADVVIEEIVGRKVKEAVDFVHGNSDASLVDYKDEEIKCVVLNADTADTEAEKKNGRITDGVYLIHKPNDYMRFLQGGMSCWSEFVTEPVTAGDSDYARVQDKYSGATRHRPAITWDGRQFRYFKGIGDKDTATLFYFPYCEVKEDKVFINRPLYPSLVYHLSGLVLLGMKDERADDMFNMALTLMGVATKGQ